mgnify:FL=1
MIAVIKRAICKGTGSGMYWQPSGSRARMSSGSYAPVASTAITWAWSRWEKRVGQNTVWTRNPIPLALTKHLDRQAEVQQEIALPLHCGGYDLYGHQGAPVLCQEKQEGYIERPNGHGYTAWVPWSVPVMSKGGLWKSCSRRRRDYWNWANARSATSSRKLWRHPWQLCNKTFFT